MFTYWVWVKDPIPLEMHMLFIVTYPMQGFALSKHISKYPKPSIRIYDKQASPIMYTKLSYPSSIKCQKGMMPASKAFGSKWYNPVRMQHPLVPIGIESLNWTSSQTMLNVLSIRVLKDEYVHNQRANSYMLLSYHWSSFSTHPEAHIQQYPTVSERQKVQLGTSISFTFLDFFSSCNL